MNGETERRPRSPTAAQGVSPGRGCRGEPRAYRNSRGRPTTLLPLARVEALHEEELCEALACELVDLLAVGVHLVGDEQRLKAARLWDGFEERVAAQLLLGQRLLATHEADLRLLLLLEQVLLLRALLSLQVALEVLQLVTFLLKVVDALDEQLHLLLQEGVGVQLEPAEVDRVGV